MKKCEAILQKKIKNSNLKLSLNDILAKRKERLKKKAKNIFMEK